MLMNKNRRSVKTAFLLILSVIGFAAITHSDVVDDPTTLPIDVSEGETFTVMDGDAMRAYRDERRETLVEALTSSNLSAEHQELIANAMAKLYVGVPVSSYTHTTRTHSSKEESIESTNTYHVRLAGHVERENHEYKSSLDNAVPFLYFPPVPFVSESGKLVDESDSNATFEFELALMMENEGEDGMMSDLADKMKWVFEIRVNTVDQAPERLTVKLANTVRQRFLFKLSKCSAIIVGRLDESVVLTNTDINCEQPVQFLLPDTQESSFLSF